jgi:hypothetical protein
MLAFFGCKTNTVNGNNDSGLEASATKNRFACGSIIGAGTSDHDFREICVSETAAVANTGKFEGQSYFYNLKRDNAMPYILYLSPDLSKGKGGNPLTLILKVKKTYTIRSIVDALTEKNITVDGAGGRVWVVGQPIPGLSDDNGSVIADNFKISN